MVYYSLSSYNNGMFLVGLLSWWYGSGWLGRLFGLRDRLKNTADYFSIGLMLTTLFSPFRQISAGRVSGSAGDQFRGFIDKTISRFVGAFMRSIMILIGVLAIIFSTLFGLVILIIWPILPLLPVFGIILTTIGWFPL